MNLCHNVLLKVTLNFALTLFSVSSMAHDYWFAPESFDVKSGLKIRTKMQMGGQFKADEQKPLSVDVTETLELHSQGTQTKNLKSSPQALQGKEFAEFPVSRPGGYWLTTERTPFFIELNAKKFEKYLEHEGLSHIIDERRKRKESHLPGREIYSRSLRTYLSVGSHNDNQTWKMKIPQRIEINPLTNPSQIQPGQKVSFEVRLNSKPLVGATVHALHAEGRTEAKILQAKTNNKGLVTFSMEAAGPWLIRTVHMRRCENCKKADWESFWGSLSLGVNLSTAEKKQI